MTCPTCKNIQWSANDISYLNLFGLCWDCDKEKLEEGQITLKEFEKKEKEADRFSVTATK